MGKATSVPLDGAAMALTCVPAPVAGQPSGSGCLILGRSNPWRGSSPSPHLIPHPPSILMSWRRTGLERAREATDPLSVVPMGKPRPTELAQGTGPAGG